MIDFFSSEHHFGPHLRPVYDALPESERGRFLQRRRAYYRGPDSKLVAVASYGDMKKCVRSGVPIALFEHGAGFAFLGVDRKTMPMWGGSYAGGPNRQYASFFPSTNRWVRDANLARYPDTPAPIVGCPKMDALVARPALANERPVIAVSAHWECRAIPETRAALPHYHAQLEELARVALEEGWTVLGHGHPRAQGVLRLLWRELGWEFVPDFNEVAARADLYVADATSTLYEFAALDRPVVVLDAPWYRRDVYHGLRFWDHADLGVRVSEPDQLLPAIRESLEYDPNSTERHEAVREVYPYLGRSAPRSAQVLRGFVERTG